MFESEKRGLILYNKRLEYLLKNEPTDVISKRSIPFRKMLGLILRGVIVPISANKKLHIEKNRNLPKDRPIIFAATHGVRDDITACLIAAGRHTFLLFGSLEYFFHSIEGVGLWLNGIILVDRKNKQSRMASKAKMEYVLKSGSDILMFPEGVINKTENLPIQKLFPGVYDVAVKSNAIVVPIATIQDGDNVFTKVGEPFDICRYSCKEGLNLLRDIMATEQFNLIEKHANHTRDYIGNTEKYRQSLENELIEAIHGFYDYEIENRAQFIDKNDITHESAFAHLNNITIKKNNAFLFNKRLK